MNWGQEIIDSLASGKRYKSILQKCIRYMESKKLYKYYCFESKHTVSNIKNDILYMQNPAEFNDPLDCNIGMSADALFEQFVPELLSKAGLNLNDNEYDLLKSLLTNKEKQYDDEQTREKLLHECLNNTAFSALYTRINEGEIVSDDEIIQMTLDNPDLLSAILKQQFNNKGDEKLPLSFSSEEIIDNICNSPAVIRKLIPSFVSEDEKTRRIISIFTKDEGMVEKIRELAVLSEHAETIKTIDELVGMMRDGCTSIHKELGKSVGVCCFTETPENMLMWSHYANKHTGLCIEYDFGKLFSNEKNAMLLPIVYSDQRPLLPLDILLKHQNGQLVFDEQRLSETIPYFLKALIAKADVWEYEKEWRLIKFIKKEEDRSVHLPLISKIITGCRISNDNLVIANDLAKEKGIPIVNCTLMSDKYRIIITK